MGALGFADPELALNMPKVVTVERPQQRTWLKAEVELNMKYMSVTLLTSHAPRFWLRAGADSKGHSSG